jgi:eukaryotic-like serine/threonine-protein kinase
MPLLPGEIVIKQYRIVSLLAEGPSGAVYRAWDQSHKRDVALKEYLDPSAQAQRLFQEEATRLMGLSHAQLPAVRDFFSQAGVGQYLVSDYIDGVDLQDLLDQYGPPPPERVVAWMQAACQPLTYLHGRGRLHLNIKPANIRQTPDDRVYLVDSGLPGLGISLRGDGFSSPEQMRQGKVTPASDMYSLGATLYTLLTGRRPPDALQRESGLMNLIPAREVNTEVPAYLSVAASRAMDLRPDVRFENAAEFATALGRSDGQPARPPTQPRRTEPGQAFRPPARLTATRRRQIERRTIWGLAGILILFLGISIGLSLASRSPEVEQAQAAATDTIRSQVVAALTAITTLTPTIPPSPTPVPTPEPLVDEKSGARMIFVPSGIFRMGTDQGEPDEAPSHIVRLDAYFIDETEVTNGQYALCVEDGVCAPPSRPGATYHPTYYGDPAYDDYPVIFVNWFNARDFCSWRGARLPSEAEWERAASFDPVEGIKYRYPWGDEFDGRLVNFCDARCPQSSGVTVNDGHRDTAPVGSYPEGRSPLGVLDMAGNVMEWAGDWYDFRYYSRSPDTNPLGPLEGEFKSLRGGSWLSGPEGVRTTGRSSYHPSVSRANLGFRCAMTAP